MALTLRKPPMYPGNHITSSNGHEFADVNHAANQNSEDFTDNEDEDEETDDKVLSLWD